MAMVYAGYDDDYGNPVMKEDNSVTYSKDSDSYWPTKPVSTSPPADPKVYGTYDSNSDTYWPTNPSTGGGSSSGSGSSNDILSFNVDEQRKL